MNDILDKITFWTINIRTTVHSNNNNNNVVTKPYCRLNGPQYWTISEL